MSLTDGLSLIRQALEKEVEEKAWGFWVTLFPHMEPEKRIPFERFMDEIKRKQQPQTMMSKEEIIRRAEAIRKADQKGVS